LAILNEAEGRRSKTGDMVGSDGEVNKDEVGKLDRGEDKRTRRWLEATGARQQVKGKAGEVASGAASRG